MSVFSTNAFINGWRDHYPPDTFPGVWDLISTALADGRVVAPREVLRELERMDDELWHWARERRHLFVDPTPDVQVAVGPIYEQFPRPGTRDAADPWVIAEAQVRRFTVVTYEGRTFSGETTRAALRRMPGICAQFDVRCITLPEAFGPLGGRF